MVAYGVSSALYHRERTGEGQYVGVSLLRSALTMQSARLIWAESGPVEGTTFHLAIPLDGPPVPSEPPVDRLRPPTEGGRHDTAAPGRP